MKLLLILVLLFIALPAVSMDEAALKKEIDDWHQSRLKSLTAEDGWLTLIGLYWLREGENKFGSDPSNVVVISNIPKLAGSFYLEKGKVRAEILPQAKVTLDGKPVTSVSMEPDTAENTTILKKGSVSLFVIERGKKFGVRVKDRESPVRVQFKGLQYYPTSAKWRVQCKFEPYKPAKSIPILNIIGIVEDSPSPGALIFQIDGKEYRIDAMEGDQKEKTLYVIFADKTSGKETYGAGRYLYSEPMGTDGTVVLDFNKAYNPPCAFTAFATCPLPPPQNKLPVRVEAGEKYSGKSALNGNHGGIESRRVSVWRSLPHKNWCRLCVSVPPWFFGTKIENISTNALETI